MDATLQLLPASDLTLFLPILTVILGAILVLVLDLMSSHDRNWLLPLVSFVTLAVSFASLMLIHGDLRASVQFFHGALRIDKLILLSHEVILGVAALIILVSPRYLKGRLIPLGEYYALMLFSVVGMMVLAASNELIVLFVNLEMLSITLYIMAGLERENLKSTEAAFKYFLIGSYSAAFLLFGLTFIYGGTGTTSITEIIDLATRGAIPQPAILAVGLTLVIVGFGYKLTLAPFHMYAPDLYAGAPTPCVAMIATGSKIAGLAAFFSIFRIIAAWQDLHTGFFYLFTVVALATIVIGNIGALAQPNIKRLLAYSGVAHAGYTLLPLIAVTSAPTVGITTDLLAQAETAVGYYLLAYGSMTVLAFAVICVLGPQGETQIDRYAGLAQRSPGLAIAMALSLASLMGLPLTVGFVGKLYLFHVLVSAELYWLAIVGVLASVASAFYYLRVINKMYMEDPVGSKEPVEPLESPTLVALAAGVVVILLFAVFPVWFLMH